MSAIHTRAPPRYEAGSVGPRLPGVAELASNESPWGPSPAAVAAAGRTLLTCHRYPEPTTTTLRARLAEDGRLHPDQVLVSAGTTALIDLIARVHAGTGRSAVFSERSFLAYAASVATAGGYAHLAPMRGDTIDLDAIGAALRPDTGVVFLANPNNPTGTAFGAAAFERWLVDVPRDVVVVLDEAYRDYALALGVDVPDGLAVARRDARVLVLRTFSKVHGLAGLRVGYAAGHRDGIARLRAHAPLFGVSESAEAAALAALDDRAHVDAAVRANAGGLAILHRGLVDLGYAPTPSAANFVHVDLHRPAEPVRDALLAAGVRVRALGAWGAPTSIRITVGSPPELTRFLRALGDLDAG